MKLIILTIALFFILVMPVMSQEIAWGNSFKWKMYAIPSKWAFKYSADTLYHFKNIELDDKIMHAFLKDAAIWPKEKYSIWMGSFVSGFEDKDGKVRKIVISSYAGFIYDVKEKRYYEIPQGKREGWYKYINEKSSELNSKIFY